MGLFAAGMRVTADDVDSYAALAAYRVSTQSVTNTTPVNDDTLFFAVAASLVYDVRATLYYTGGTQGSSDLKIAWNTPSGATWRWSLLRKDTTGTLATSDQHLAADTETAGTVTGGTVRVAKVEGTLAVASTTGTFGLQFCQATNAAGTPTVMQPYSRLVAVRIA
ncbi:MAG TPA: hypothetical protein VIZ43_10930 [Trebonia sp.]